MDAKELALVQGWTDTKQTLGRWNRDPRPILREWVTASVAIAFALLVAVDFVAAASTPDLTRHVIPGVNARGTLRDVGTILFHNSLVLALHAMACVAGFMAGSSIPQLAQSKQGLSRIVHERAGPLAIGFVVCATTFSIVTQAYILGNETTTIAHQLRMPVALLLLGLAPHALPELAALFLPLAAWILASRGARWSELLAATFVTVAIAVPVLVTSAFVEVYLTPHLLKLL